MKRRVWISHSSVRTGVLLAAMAAYILLMAFDVIRTLALTPPAQLSWSLWLRLGFSALLALLFLAVGGLAWQYARQRTVAWLLFGFCLAVMATFTVETGAVANDPLFNKISSADSALSFALLSILLFLFPKNLLAGRKPPENRGPRARRRLGGVLLAWGYLALLALSCTANLLSIILCGPLHSLPVWAQTLSGAYDFGVLLAVLLTMIVSYLRSTSLRERQQMRFLVVGVILAVVPLLSLTVLPGLLSLPALAVDGQVSASTLVLLPLALGYSVLRYQLLMADRSIRRIATWIVAGVTLIVLGYLAVVLPGVFFSGIVYTLCVAALTALLVGIIPRLAVKMIERLFFGEFAAYRQRLQDHDWYLREGLDFEKTTELLTVAFMDAFDIPAAALYLLDEQRGSFSLVQGREASAESPKGAARLELVQRLAAHIHGERQWKTQGDGGLDADREVQSWIAAQLERLMQARRPLFSSEIAAGSAGSGGLAHFFGGTAGGAASDDLLIIPIHALGKVIGILAIGERPNGQPYAGPDFEIIRLLLARFAPVLDNCLLSERALRLEAVAATDPLTRLPNHRALLECGERELERARRFGRPVSVIFFDGDHFKRVNDTHGHAVGDAVLRELGERARAGLRAGDTLGRYGGEEFAVILPETDGEEAVAVAERIRAAVAAFPLASSLVAGGIPITVSVGLATFPGNGNTLSEILEQSDQAMYWAKRLGRNQVRTPLDTQRAIHNAALAATISSLERRDDRDLDGLNPEQLLRADQAALVYSITRLLDLRDQGITIHSYQVSDLAAAIAKEMGLGSQAVVDVSTAALLHDIGKIGVPDAILQKVGPLSPSERDVIRQHPEQGAMIVEDTPALSHLARAIRGHHERWDGTGYPARIAGNAIPLEARIIAVAEAYHAMMSDRPYQSGRSSEEARSELKRCAGTHFDPEIVQAALLIIDREPASAEKRDEVDVGV